MAVLGAAAAGALPQITISTSQTWVAPQSGNICIHVIGGGGSGSLSLYTGGAFYNTSGAGAGYCKKNSLAVTSGDSFTIVVGGGGGSRNGADNTSARHTDGVTGGNSTVAGPGLSATLTANGGGMGYKGDGSTINTSSVGGTASGGDVNNTGGIGRMGGGGAVGVHGTGAAGNNLRSNVAGATCLGGSSDAGGYDQIFDSTSSGYGQIIGGRGGKGNTVGSLLLKQNMQVEDGGFLCGGGSFLISGGAPGSYEKQWAGNGGAGGGGGCVGAHTGNSSSLQSGRGGNGIVLIQYLP
jgi:hypothetical protein